MRFRGTAVAIFQLGGVLLRKALGFVVAGILPFVAAAALLTPRPVTVSLPADVDASQALVVPDIPSDGPEQGESATDLFGNPVTDAVARYKFDATGSLYELHSPQTEVPRLRPPKT
jgi:hypothetical protein